MVVMNHPHALSRFGWDGASTPRIAAHILGNSQTIACPVQFPVQGPFLRRQHPRRSHVRNHMVRPSVAHPANLRGTSGAVKGWIVAELLTEL